MRSNARPESTARPGAPARPRRLGLQIGDFDALAFLAGFVAVGMWLRHGGFVWIDDISGWARGFGQLSALLGTIAALYGVFLVGRAPFLEAAMAPDRLIRRHRLLGFVAVWALLVHAVTSTIAFGSGMLETFPDDLLALIATVPGMLGAAVSLGLFLLVAVTSTRPLRRRLSYETWHGLHLYVYLAIAFAYLHQFTIGSDFTSDRLAQIFWTGLYVVAFAPLLFYRVLGPLLRYLLHGFRVEHVTLEAPGIVSLYIGGRLLRHLPSEAGQYFGLRALTRELWWRSFPFSLSAAPDGRSLRFTIKVLGDGSWALANLPVGTPILLEGPRGDLTERKTGKREPVRGAVLLAGGIGITPLRALFESLPPGPGLDLFYRVPDPDELVFREELDWLVRERGGQVHYLVGRRGEAVSVDPFGPERLLAAVPDIAEREAYLCGPEAMMVHAERALRYLGVPEARIHYESFAW